MTVNAPFSVSFLLTMVFDGDGDVLFLRVCEGNVTAPSILNAPPLIRGRAEGTSTPPVQIGSCELQAGLIMKIIIIITIIMQE